MTQNPAFARPGALDRLRLWWSAKDGSARTNLVLFAVVAAVAVGLVATAASRESSGVPGLGNATRPHLGGPGFVPTTSMAIDVRAAGVPDSRVEVADPAAPTSSTVAVAATVPAFAGVSPSVATTSSVAPATTVPASGVIYSEVPAPGPAPPSALSATTVPVATTASPSTTSPVPTSTTPTSTTPTTASTILPPLPIDIPPLLSGPR